MAARNITSASSWPMYVRTLNSYYLKSDPAVLIGVQQIPQRIAQQAKLRPYHTIDQKIAYLLFSAAAPGDNIRIEPGVVVEDITDAKVAALHATPRQMSVSLQSTKYSGALITHSYVDMSASVMNELALSPYLKWNKSTREKLQELADDTALRSTQGRLVMVTLKHSTDLSDVRATVLSVNQTVQPMSNLYDTLVRAPSICFSFDTTDKYRISDIFTPQSAGSVMTQYRRFCDPNAYRAAGVVGGMLQSAQLYILGMKLALNWPGRASQFATRMQRITNALHPDRGENELIRLVQRMQVEAGAVVPFTKQAPSGSNVPGPTLLLPLRGSKDLYVEQLSKLFADGKLSLSSGR